MQPQSFTPSAQQHEAITSDHPRICCLAGPGAGKTRTVIQRILRLVEEGASPKSIVAISYTNKAADEMVRRLGDTKIGFCGTLHSFMLNLIQSHRHVIGYKSRVTVLDEESRTVLLNKILLTHRSHESQKAIDEVLARGIPTLTRSPSKLELVAKDFYDTMTRTCTIDFESILIFGLELLDRFPEIGINIAGHKVTHLFVDEFQDCTDRDFLTIQKLPVDNRFLVGDPDQCQPPGTLIRSGDGITNVPIENLSVGDSVTAYYRKGKYLIRSAHVGQISSRHFCGTMYRVECGTKSAESTGGHKWLVKWLSGPARESHIYCTYLMRKGDYFRIGKTRFFRSCGHSEPSGYAIGVWVRLMQEKADCVWVLKTHETNPEATSYESIMAATYGLSGVCFRAGNLHGGFTQEVIDSIFAAIPKQLKKAVQCLSDHGRELEFPLFSSKDPQTRRTVQEVMACNLMDDVMQIPVAADYVKRKEDSSWHPIKVTRRHYDGPVFSLDIPNYHKYVSNGLVTCNSIFGFRKGSVRHIVDISADSRWHKVMLESNYRSNVEICDSAQGLIEHNKNRVQKVTKSERGPGGHVNIVPELRNPGMERSMILDLIGKLQRREPSVPFTEMAVLVRTNALVQDYAGYLKNSGIPVAEKSRPEVPDDFEKAKLLVMLIDNPTNDFVAHRFLTIELGAVTANAVAKKAGEEFATVIKQSGFFDPRLIPPDIAGQLEFAWHYVKTFCSPESLRLFEKQAEALAKTHGKDFDLQDLILAVNQDAFEETVSEGVTVSTVHSAKGLEWAVVFLPAFEDEVIPGTRKELDVEEERRLVFVAMTRAKNCLVISHCEGRTRPWTGDKIWPASPSRFLKEIH